MAHTCDDINSLVVTSSSTSLFSHVAQSHLLTQVLPQSVSCYYQPCRTSRHQAHHNLQTQATEDVSRLIRQAFLLCHLYARTTPKERPIQQFQEGGLARLILTTYYFSLPSTCPCAKMDGLLCSMNTIRYFHAKTALQRASDASLRHFTARKFQQKTQ